MRERIGCVAFVLLMLSAAGVRATETQWWSANSPSDYAKAVAHGVLVGADGALVTGPESVSFPDDSLHVAWAVAVLSDGSVAIGGEHGRIDRWEAGRGIRPWLTLPGGQVLCLARVGADLLAGTGPGGLVFRIGPHGDTTRVATTGERYVWALAPGAGGAVWAATGTHGKLMRIEAGRARTVFDSDESNLLCALADGAGGVWTGGDSHGRIYHTAADGVTRTEFDAAEDEVRALARGSDGALYAAAMSASATSTASEDASEEDEKPAPARSPIVGGHAVIYRLVPDSATVAWWNPPQPLVYSLLGTPEGVLVATGNRAGLYRVEHVNWGSELLAPAPAQVTALAAGNGGAVWAVTANPVTLWKLGPDRAAHGELLSAALDARHFARFGAVRWTARGDVRLSTRSGNSDPPDTTWSPWRAVESAEDGGRVASPAARYLQWKVELGSAEARVDEVDIAWREQNLAPRVDEITVAPQGLNFREGEMLPRSESVTQTLPAGQKVEYSVSLPSSKPIRELPLWARGLRTLTWKASDPNGDALRFRVEIRNESGGTWIEIGKDLEGTVYTWNTNTIPDGRYRLRVTASDGLANAVGEERTAEAMSEPFTVDNTPPTLGEVTAQGARITGEASDATSPIWRLEVAVDDGDWRTVTPVGGLADSRHVRYAATLAELKPGSHLVSVRAVDLAGNSATRAVHVEVPAAR
ncbi:MAG TPA: hypothetical protein VMH61_06675 [Candidatus Acidoferrales bacterium]|nr:hypothetical protein [Candidatus Acidoferrales bacterium]